MLFTKDRGPLIFESPVTAVVFVLFVVCKRLFCSTPKEKEELHPELYNKGLGIIQDSIPANKSMNRYFISNGSKFRGRPLTTLPVVLNKDLTRVSDDKLQLTSLKDLEHLRSVAQNRQTWRKLTTRIREAAEASPSDD